jgi:translation initiation factor 3 subunit A
MARLEREAAEREQQRRLDEHKEIQRKVAKERLEQLKSTSVGAKAFADRSEDVCRKMYCQWREILFCSLHESW